MLTKSKSVQSAVWEMVEAGGRTAQSFGVSRLLGQIYTLLFMYNRPLSLDEIASELQVSKASVSIACRQLYNFGAVRRITQRGDRRDFYESEQDFKGLLQNGILPILEKKLESARIQIENSRKMLDGVNVDEAEQLMKNLGNAERSRARIAALIKNPLLRRML